MEAGGGKVALLQVADILVDLVEVKDKKLLAGLKVAQLYHTVEARGTGGELLQRREFQRREGKILLALVGGEARPAIQRVNFLVPQDTEPFRGCGDSLHRHAGSRPYPRRWRVLVSKSTRYGTS